MPALVRFGLLLLVLSVCVAVIAIHGARGIAFVVVLMAIFTVPQTRAWTIAERGLVRLTGSRRRAAALVLAVTVGSLIAINIYELVHG
jgi:hypothetical protein